MLSLLLSCTPIQSRSCPQGADCTPQVADSAQDSLLVDTQDAWTWDEEDVAMLIGKARSYRSIQGAITEAADGVSFRAPSSAWRTAASTARFASASCNS